jgi:hypothetical protein
VGLAEKGINGSGSRIYPAIDMRNIKTNYKNIWR